MIRKALIVVAGLASAGLAPTANAQCLECAQQMYQATLVSNSIRSQNEVLNMDTYRRDARNGVCYARNQGYPGCSGRSDDVQRSTPSQSIGTLTENAVMGVLKAEYQRRAQAYGRDNAAQWLNKASGDVGRQVVGLLSEFRNRSIAGDAASANAWLVDNARKTAQRYVSNNSSASIGNVAIGGVPAATRKLAEDAAFAILEPEINQRNKLYGRAKAVEWAQSMGTAVGTGVKNLAPEYVIRAKADGAASADKWYADQSRRLAIAQIRSN